MRKWIIVSDGGRPLGEIATDLTAAGLTEVETQLEIGIILGKADVSIANALRAVPNVANVGEDIQFYTC